MSQGQGEGARKPFLLPQRVPSPPELLRDFSGSRHIKSSLAGLVKAVNTAVDLIVAHFGTSRDPGVKVGKELRRAELCLLTLTFPVPGLPPGTQS